MLSCTVMIVFSRTSENTMVLPILRTSSIVKFVARTSTIVAPITPSSFRISASSLGIIEFTFSRGLILLAAGLFITSSALALSQPALVLTLIFALTLSAFVFRRLQGDGPFRPAWGSPVLLIPFDRFYKDPYVTPPFLAFKNSL